MSKNDLRFIWREQLGLQVVNHLEGSNKRNMFSDSQTDHVHRIEEAQNSQQKDRLKDPERLNREL